MSYNPTTDFPALLRQTSSGVEPAEIPGLDFVVAALARAGLITLSVGQTAPTANQATTAWFKPAQPSWTAEGVLYLWNSATAQYVTATPALWTALISASGYAFQSATLSNNFIVAGITLVAVQRAAPAATALALPNLISQWITGRRLQIVDFSTAITSHIITVTPANGATIMQRGSLRLRSTADSLASVTLQPSPDLNSWIIAP